RSRSRSRSRNTPTPTNLKTGESMRTSSPEVRVHTAADEIEREGGKPTVATVRERAGVNNADATRYLREWREGRAASGATIASLPPALIEHSQRVAGLMWAEASQLAGAAHAAVEREWYEQTALQTQEIAELVVNLDAADLAAKEAAGKHAAEKADLEAALDAAAAETAHVRAELREVREERATLEKQIIEERAAAQALRATIDALIARIPAAEEEAK
ncbi:DNA-binding protein, partial [Microbacterium sp. HJ5]